MMWVGDRFTTLPSREIDPKTARKIRKALGSWLNPRQQLEEK